MNYTGLSSEEAHEQIKRGNTNHMEDSSDKTVKQIVKENVFTYFNLIFLVISILLIAAGSFRSLTFLPVIVANTVIGIFQQIRAKKTLDKLSLLDKAEYTVIRDGKEKKLISDDLVKGDLVSLEAGQQIPADGYIEEGTAYVNESLLTGEADEIEKVKDSPLKSGSFVVSGSAFMVLTDVGEDSYAAKLMKKAKKVTEKKSEMIRDIETIIKIAGILIIPIGIILFAESLFSGRSFSTSIESMVAAVIGMIPEGMYLLTTIALALSAMRLAKKQVLLHDMRSIETLARVDVLCVDKTGTITDTNMKVTEIFSPVKSASDADSFLQNESGSKNESGESGLPEDVSRYEYILSKYVRTLKDSNITMDALRKYLPDRGTLDAAETSEFSSRYKYSSVTLTDGTLYRLGAPEMLLSEEQIRLFSECIEKRTGEGMRVLAFVEIRAGKSNPVLFISLENNIRENARKIFENFAEAGVVTKVISGDSPLTVSKVAARAGIKGADRYIDASRLKTEEAVKQAVTVYNVFGRVKPEQKKLIVKALQERGLKVAMTGDGVNDILAMKEADCSIAMGSGSDAARQAAQVVLMDSDFGHMNEIVYEGRKDINNITRSATLFLYKNMFSMFLALFSIINVFTYPLQPSQISLVSMFNIGIPSFFLALEPNKNKQEGRFIIQTILSAMPAALTSFFSIAAMVLFSDIFGLRNTDIGTACTCLLSVVGFIILFQLSEPLNLYRGSIIAVCIAGFILCLKYFSRLFAIERLTFRCVILCIVFALAEITVMRWLTKVFGFFKNKRRKSPAEKKR